MIRPHFEPTVQIAVHASCEDGNDGVTKDGVDVSDAGVGFGDLYKFHSAMPAP